MKIFRVLFFILLGIIGLILVIPFFLPSSITVSSRQQVAAVPAQVFVNSAHYVDRDNWDPWLTMESDAEVVIKPVEGYMGSSYSWTGEEIGSGSMVVDSVHFPNYIASSIYFGASPNPALVEWIIAPEDDGSLVTWQFTNKGGYPFGRLINQMIKGNLQKSFDEGLAAYKSYLEENPPKMFRMDSIAIDTFAATNAMVIPVEGTMEEITGKFSVKYQQLFQEMGKQGIVPMGAPFAHYMEFDPLTTYSRALLGAPVDDPGKPQGEVSPSYYPAMVVLAGLHIGEYEGLSDSYTKLTDYAKQNDIAVTGEAFEIYLKGMMASENPMDWETLILFPIK